MNFGAPLLKTLLLMIIVAIIVFAATYNYFTYTISTKTISVTVTSVSTTSIAIPSPITLTIPTTSTVVVPGSEVKYPITIIDSAGRNVTFDKEPQRVVAISSTQVMVLLALGVGDRIVGASDTVIQDPLLMSLLPRKDIVNTGGFSSPSIEAILSAKPDLVIFYASFYRSVYDEIASKLPRDIKVVYFDLYKLDRVFDEIYKLGLIFNRVDRALNIISKWSSRLISVAAKTADISSIDRVKVFFEGYTELAAAGPGSGWHQALTLAGGINIFGDVSQAYPKVSPEAVIERNPSVIIKVVSLTTYNPCKAVDTKTLESIYKTIVSRPGWSEISAVKNNRVYVYSTAYLDGPGYVIQVALLAKLFYPQQFKDLDVKQWIYDWLIDMGLKEPWNTCKVSWIYPDALR